MKFLRLTRSESRWLSIFSFFGFIVFALFLIQPLLSSYRAEPLADATSLKLLLAGKPLPVPADERTGEFYGTKVSPPLLSSLPEVSGVLGHSSAERHVEVDLTHQKVYAVENGQKVYEFTVSTGKWAPTPTGEFTIWAKVRSQKMSGGVPGTGTYYYLPNVPWVMFFGSNEIPASRGFSLHGTYWHNNFGHPMSHGCINMRIEDAKTLFEWADPVVTNAKAWSTNSSADNPGTKIIIYGTAPRS
ncbi:MAG: hypothetical protein ACD_36C00086G0002 [uncultured bacterium]|uniref:L,D-TPase catalytic domain-containing protein n=1 Tax=Candidatus Gottesmanbacteria bacterium RIFCSPLOWO2_01_FULL_43_11b TaxID=1798392 RepID=A0A1F6AHB2_9BACT|nr:MAG: hypothetical protein ACD_36C00086G0002 [uncultured bacterium]OGG23842.1 MAG: hypothetical protein A3A79_01400 [Candidatus Gottesmanbacteria bacterium RIFCSPLOWO2_01_FULL_43_11b]